ncbi:MAG: YiiX/YebB-like N1pC/P60 family cysteine hydrolase [Myxococcota bacterium]
MEQPLLTTDGMPMLFRLVCLSALVAAAGRPQPAEVTLQTGDVVLQTSRSSRSALIRRASASPYSHVGVVERTKDGVFVIEAIQPVSRTPLAKWVKRGEGGAVTVLRPKGLDAAARAKVVEAAKRELGKPYDARYRWDDEALYCSELVVKAFERGAGVTVGKQEVVKSLHLTPAELALGPKLGIDPEQTLVTPASLVGDPALETVAAQVTRVK